MQKSTDSASREAQDASLALFWAVFEHSPVPYQIYRAEGSCAWVNRAYEQLFGAAPPPEYNLLADEPLNQQGFVELFQRARAGETVRAPQRWYDMPALTPNQVGRRVGIEVTFFPVPDADGRISQVGLCFKDVTVEMDLQIAAAKSEQLARRYRSTFEEAAIGVAHVAPDGQWLEVNQRLCDIVGYTRGELLVRTFQDITYAPDLGIDVEFVRKMLAHELETYCMEKRYVKKDGALVWIELTVSLVRDEAGAPEYFISLVQDISERRRIQSALSQSSDDLQAEVLERRRAQEALRESEESLATTLNSIGDAVIATDTEGRITRMNTVAAQLTGWAPEEAQGLRLSEVIRIFDEDTREPVENPVDRVLREGAIVGLGNHTVLVARDGAERAIGSSGAPIRDAQGTLRGVVLVFRDQTDDRNVQRALRNSEARKRAILEAALDSIVTMDHSGRITEFNPAAERTFGYSRSAALGQPLVDLLIPPSLRAQHLAGLERYRATGVGPILSKRVELNALRADGSEFPVELTVVPTDCNDAPMFTAYVRDLTESRRAAEALRASEARFGLLADSGLIGIMIADTVGNIHEANHAFLDIVGYPRDELTSGKLRWTDMTPPEQRHLDDAAVAQLAQTGFAKPWEKEYIRKDGSRAPVLVGVARLDESRGIAFVLDLSERNRAQQAGAHAVRIAARESATRERAEAALRQMEEQLRQSQKMEAVGRLAGGIAHDFNNVLSIILGYAELLLDSRPAADPGRIDLEQIVEAARRASELTRHLLAFSRQQVLEPKVLSLNDAVSKMTQMLRRLIGEDVELSVQLAPNIGAVLVDPSQIEQVLLNLVVNARDAMPRGGRLTIETAELELDEAYAATHLDVVPGRYISLSVSDTGMGMDSATQARIFEPFFTTKEKGRGTGLGLSTVFGIVKQSGGTIWVYSEPGKGSTFKVYLPRTNVIPDASALRSGAARAALRDNHGTETVLLVEDNAELRNLISAILSRNGYEVLEAATADAALTICDRRDEVIHLLLTDVVLPGMSGRELWERVAPARPATKVLFMSGYADDAIVRHGVLRSDVSFIQKPLMPGPLLSKLREVLEHPGASPAAER